MAWPPVERCLSQERKGGGELLSLPPRLPPPRAQVELSWRGPFPPSLGRGRRKEEEVDAAAHLSGPRNESACERASTVGEIRMIFSAPVSLVLRPMHFR